MLLIGMAALGLALKVAPKVAAIDDTIIYGHRPPADEPFIAPPIQDVIQDMDADVSDLTIEEELEQREKDAEEALAEEGGYDPGEFANYSDGNLEVACGLTNRLTGAKRFPEACEELESRRVDQQEEEEKKEPEIETIDAFLARGGFPIDVVEFSLSEARTGGIKTKASQGAFVLPNVRVALRNNFTTPLALQISIQYQMDALTIPHSVSDNFMYLNSGQQGVLDYATTEEIGRDDYPVKVLLEVYDEGMNNRYSIPVAISYAPPRITTIPKAITQAFGEKEGKVEINRMDQFPDDDGGGYFLCFYRAGNPTDTQCSRSSREDLEFLVNSPDHVVYDVMLLSDWEGRQ